ncbi:MAG: YhcH/YjgK/YiaL family protein [Spirochaetales bacterium]
MILDSLNSSSRYECLGPRFAQAFAWLRTVDPTTLPDGKTVLDGDNLFVITQRGLTKPLDQVKWEAHQKYADIQYLASGTEEMRWQALEFTQTEDYVEEKDFVPLNTDVWTTFEVIEGQFAVFFPDDAHRPSIEVPGAPPVVKLVVKVRL